MPFSKLEYMKDIFQDLGMKMNMKNIIRFDCTENETRLLPSKNSASFTTLEAI